MSLHRHRTANDLEAKDGISLLSLKNHLMMSYLHSLALLIPHRILGHTLLDRTPPSEPFSSAQRSARGTGAGDLVDSIVEGRIVLEKVKVLEGRMKYQIEKLVRLATENTATVDSNVANGMTLYNLLSGHMLTFTQIHRSSCVPT
jgi:U3 small nucleolar ribonucleoprotein protein LCP5